MIAKEPRLPRSAISEPTTRRLSIYLRCLEILAAAGVRTVSSKELAKEFHLNSAQFRKDLAYFGDFGVRGVGYDVDELKARLKDILGLNREVSVAIIGAGNLGMALADYEGFNVKGFRVVALMDADERKIGRMTRGGLKVQDWRRLGEITAENPIDIAILAVPADAGQAVLDRVAEAGIPAVLSFVPARLKVPEEVRLKTVDLKVQMESLVFHLSHRHADAAASRHQSAS